MIERSGTRYEARRSSVLLGVVVGLATVLVAVFLWTLMLWAVL